MFILFLIGLLFIAPNFFLLIDAFDINQQSISFSLLLEYGFNSIILASISCVIAAILGVYSAIMVTFFKFKGAKILKIMMPFPLAIPIFVNAVLYGKIFYHTSHYIPPIIFEGIVMGITFYPYVYVICIPKMQAIKDYIVIAKTLGYSHWGAIIKVALPLLKTPAIAGSLLVFMEVSSDFATSNFFGVSTLTTGVYRAWFLMYNRPLASLTTWILFFIITLVIIIGEKAGKTNNKISPLSLTHSDIKWYFSITNPYLSSLCFLCTFIPPFFGFFLSVIKLLEWSLQAPCISCISLSFNTIIISSIASIIIVIFGAFISYSMRKNLISKIYVRITSIGYAVPGVVFAIAVIMFLGKISNFINQMLKSIGIESEIFLTGSVSAIIYAYIFRFLSLPINSVEGCFRKIPSELEYTAKLLSNSKLETWKYLYLPFIYNGLISGFLLTFLDSIKEMSATLAIRPFNFETLSTKVWYLTMNEQYIESAPYALCIIALGLGAVIFLTNISGHGYLRTKKRSVILSS